MTEMETTTTGRPSASRADRVRFHQRAMVHRQLRRGIRLNGVSSHSPPPVLHMLSRFLPDERLPERQDTLDFIVNNSGGPTGLRVEMTGTADPMSVPEPAPSPLGAGLCGWG